MGIGIGAILVGVVFLIFIPYRVGEFLVYNYIGKPHGASDNMKWIYKYLIGLVAVVILTSVCLGVGYGLIELIK